jgi:hypothetical protein
MLRDLANALRELRLTFGESCGSYRPDLHYMRGPGPKWHAKYGSLDAAKRTSTTTASARTAADSAEPALGELANRGA